MCRQPLSPPVAVHLESQTVSLSLWHCFGHQTKFSFMGSCSSSPPPTPVCSVAVKPTPPIQGIRSVMRGPWRLQRPFPWETITSNTHGVELVLWSTISCHKLTLSRTLKTHHTLPLVLGDSSRFLSLSYTEQCKLYRSKWGLPFRPGPERGANPQWCGTRVLAIVQRGL